MAKKIVLVIVEGKSDEQALGLQLTRYVKPSNLHIEITHGDITSRDDVDDTNILSKVCDIVKDFIKDSKERTKFRYKKSDISEIVHLIDTDGAFVSDEYIVENPLATELIYSDTAIEGPSREAIAARNRQKSSCMRRLAGCKKIWQDIPYRAFYMSCNLDHVLYDKRGLTDDEKADLSFAFNDRFHASTDGFIEFISHSDFSVQGSFKETWDFIAKDCHSLERHTNLGLFFRKDHQGE